MNPRAKRLVFPLALGFKQSSFPSVKHSHSILFNMYRRNLRALLDDMFKIAWWRDVASTLNLAHNFMTNIPTCSQILIWVTEASAGCVFAIREVESASIFDREPWRGARLKRHATEELQSPATLIRLNAPRRRLASHESAEWTMKPP